MQSKIYGYTVGIRSEREVHTNNVKFEVGIAATRLILVLLHSHPSCCLFWMAYYHLLVAN